MKRVVLTIFTILLIASSSWAQQSKGTAVAQLSGRTVIGTLPKLIVYGPIEGVVVVKILVDQYGLVQSATANLDETTTTHKDILKAARSAAMKAHFNMSADAPALQHGTITYTFVVSDSVDAQETTFSFLGIPVDGRMDAVVSALKNKDFDYKGDYLTGIFNGENVRLYIGTNHGIVDMITVEYPYCSDDNDTRVKYNTLLSRFNRNSKYITINPRKDIPIEEVIDSKLYKNSKYYDAIYFFLQPNIKRKEWVQQFKQEYQGRYNKPLDGLSYEELEEALFCLSSELSEAVSGIVWFTLTDPHRIKINYVNLNNRPHGEDL